MSERTDANVSAGYNQYWGLFYLVCCLAGNFLLRAAAAAGGTLISLFLASQVVEGGHVSAMLVGLLAVFFYAAEVIGAQGFGVWSDLRGRKPFMVLGPVLGATAIGIIVAIPLIPVVLASRVIQGLSTASSVPSNLSYLSAITAHSEKVRGRVMAAFEVLTIVGMAAGFAAGGFLWDKFKIEAFVLVLIIYVASLLLFLLVKDRPVETKARQERKLGTFFSFFRSRSALLLIPAWISVNAIVGLWFTHIAFQLAKTDDPSQLLVGGYTGTQIGLFTAAFAILFVIGIGCWAATFGRLRSTQIMTYALGGIAALVVLLFFLNSSAPGEQSRITVLLVLISVALLVTSGFTPAALTYLAQIAERFPESRGSLMGLYSVFLGVGQLIGGGLGGFFAEWQGVTGMIIFTGILAVISGLFVMMLIREERSGPEAQNSPTTARMPTSFH